MGLKPFWYYYGGKSSLARYYPPPIFDTIVEPFAGSAGYSLRWPERKVILVERYHVVAEIWRWLISATSEDVLRVPLVENVDDLPSGTPEGARYLVGFCLNKAATSPRKKLSIGVKRGFALGRKLGGWGESRRALVAEQVSAIKHWKIVEGDYTESPDVEATWLVDPPYSNPAGRAYVHHQIDYPALAEWCRGRRGQKIVCENIGATWLPFVPFTPPRPKVMGRTSQQEAIWTE